MFEKPASFEQIVGLVSIAVGAPCGILGSAGFGGGAPQDRQRFESRASEARLSCSTPGASPAQPAAVAARHAQTAPVRQSPAKVRDSLLVTPSSLRVASVPFLLRSKSCFIFRASFLCSCSWLRWTRAHECKSLAIPRRDTSSHAASHDRACRPSANGMPRITARGVGANGAKFLALAPPARHASRTSSGSVRGHPRSSADTVRQDRSLW